MSAGRQPTNSITANFVSTMTIRFLLRTLLLAEAIALCSAGGSTEKPKVSVSSRVEIKEPARLAGDLTHHGALFGKNYFGQSMENIMYYTKRPLCDGQLPDTPAYIKQQGYFLLVDRGECSFVEKIRNAQKDGAAAVFIADDRCLCSEDGLCETNVNEVCEKSEPFMDDDGTGSDITIPSMLLLKSDADRLRQEIVSGSIVETSISFPVPKASSSQTSYMLFTTPGDPASHQFLNSFLEAALGFGSKAVFQPRMMLSDGTQKGCRQYDDSHVPCKGHCSNYGRYCEAPSTFDKAHYNNKGTKVMVESMRRTCIWNIYGKVDGIGKEWWAYVELWGMKCSYSQYSASCAESIYDAVGIDKEEVEMCMENSGNFRENVRNTLMETSLSDIEKYQVKFAPTLVVNGAVINGSLTFGSAMAAICSTFEELDRPDICDKWDACSETCSKDESCILWGDKQECSAYRAPNIGNEGKEFNDDYLSQGLDPETSSDPEIPSADIPYEETEIPMQQQEWSNINDEAEPVFDGTIESPVDWKDNIPTLQKIEETVPPKVVDPQFIPQTSVEVSPTTATTKQISDEKHDFVETIEIFEGSSSDLAIGLGVGFGAAFLLLFVWFMISRERERHAEDYIGRTRRRGRRSRLLRSRRRCYDDYSDDSSESSDEDNFSDEEDYYNERRRVRRHRDSRHYYSKHGKRDRQYSKKSDRKSRKRLLRKERSPEPALERSEEEMPFTTRSRSIHRQIDEDEFSNKYESDGDVTPKAFVGGKKYDHDEDDDE